jgi:hypothetical protein
MVDTFANADFGGSLSGNNMTVGGPLNLNVGGDFTYGSVSLGSPTDNINVSGNADVGSLNDQGSLNINVGGSGNIDAFNVGNNLNGAFGGNLTGGSMSVGGATDLNVGGDWDYTSADLGGNADVNVNGNALVDDLNAGQNLTAFIGGNFAGTSMNVDGTTTLDVGNDWTYGSATLGGDADVTVGGNATVEDLLASGNLLAMVGNDFMGTTMDVGNDATLDVGGTWMYDTVNIGGLLTAVVGGETKINAYAGNQVDLTSGSATFGTIDTTGPFLANIDSDMTIDSANFGDDTEINAGGNVDVIDMTVNGSLLTSIDRAFTFDNLTGSRMNIGAGTLNLGRLSGTDVSLAIGGNINNRGAFIRASSINMTAGGNIGGGRAIPMNVGRINDIVGGGDVNIRQEKPGETPIGRLQAGGTLTVDVPQGGLVDGNTDLLDNSGFNLVSGANTDLNGQFFGTVQNALEVNVGGNIRIDGAGLSGDQLENQARVFGNFVGDILGGGRSIQYLGNVPIPGLVFLNAQLLLGDQFILEEVARTEAFVVETPEIRSPEGVFGDPYFIHLYMQISEAWNLFLDFILFGEAQVNADPEMPPDAKRTIKIGGAEKPYSR